MSIGTGHQPLREGLLPFGHRHRGALGKGLAFTCLLAASRLALPLPLTGVVEYSAGPAQQPAVLPGWVDPVALLATTFVSLALFAGMAEHYQRLAFAHFAGRSISDARSAAIARISGDAPGDMTAQVMADSARTKQGLKGVLNHFTLNGLLVLGGCFALGVADLRLGLVQFAGTLVLVAVALVGATRAAAMAAEHRHGESLLAGVVNRFVGGQSGRDIDDLQQLRAFDAASGEADTNMTCWEGRTTCAVHVILAVTAAAVLALGVSAANDGRLGTGALFAVVAYLLMVHGPAVRLARQITRVGPLLVSADYLGRALVDESNRGAAQAPAGARHRRPRGSPVPGVHRRIDTDTSSLRRQLRHAAGSLQAGRHRRRPSQVT